MKKSKINITKKINLIVVILFPNNKNKINNINIKNTAMSKDDIKMTKQNYPKQKQVKKDNLISMKLYHLIMII